VRVAAVVGIIAVAAGCVAEPVRRPPAQGSVTPSTAPDPDAAMLGHDCLACHSGDLVLQQRLTDKQWAKALEKMRTWGAPTEDEGVAPLLAQLVAIGEREAGTVEPRVLTVEEAGRLFARLPDGRFAGGSAARGRTLYAHECAACHADDAKGGTMGVALAGTHVLDRAPEFAAIVRAGRGRMPSYDRATDAEIANFLAYLRSL